MKKFTKAIIGVSAAAAIAVAAVTPVIVNAWGNNTAKGRQTYTKAEIEGGALGNKIVFNSINDNTNEYIKDERDFVGALPTSQVKDSGNTWQSNTINVEDGQTYTIMTYVHNNSPLGEQGVAHNVKANIDLPTAVGTELPIISYISADNADPSSVWDEVVFKSSDEFYVEYVKGSATYRNNIGTFNLPDSIILSQGASLGYTSMNGEIPGCYQYAGQVFIKVKVHKGVSASLDKKVRLKGSKDWSEAVDAKVGDEVEYRIEYFNLLNDTVNNVMIRDFLPNNVEYVPGSTILKNANFPDGLKVENDTIATSTGINIGGYTSQSNAIIYFTGKVVDKSMACGSNQLVNWVNATISGNIVARDDASVMVNKTCPDEPVNPEPTPDNPTPTPSTPAETPTTIVDTGAGTIVTGAVGAGSTVTALGYYIASRKKLM